MEMESHIRFSNVCRLHIYSHEIAQIILLGPTQSRKVGALSSCDAAIPTILSCHPQREILVLLE